MAHITINMKDGFNFEKILKFRPFFFFFNEEPVRTVLFHGTPLELRFKQNEWDLRVELSKEVSEDYKKALAQKIAFCFGADETFSKFHVMCENDEVLSQFLDKIEGNRLVSAFNDFEAIVSIICSQNVSFAQYKEMVRKLVQKYGYRNSFPAPRTIIENAGNLKECGVGYRDTFILEAAKKLMLKGTLTDDDLNSMHGIGPYSRDIFRLFQKRDYSAFYVDTLIKKIFLEDYGANLVSDADVRAFARKKFGEFSGLAELYLQKFLNDVDEDSA